MLYRLTAKHLPYPKALCQAIERGDVAVAFAVDGSQVYVISPTCANACEVRAAIELRNRWELRIATAEGALLSLLAIAAALIWTDLNSN